MNYVLFDFGLRLLFSDQVNELSNHIEAKRKADSHDPKIQCN